MKNYRSHKDIIRAARNILKKKSDEEGSMDQETFSDFFDQDNIDEKEEYGMDRDVTENLETSGRSADLSSLDIKRVEDKYKGEIKEGDRESVRRLEIEKDRRREREELVRARTVEEEPAVQVVASYSTEDQAEYIAHMVHYLISSRQVWC